MIYTYCKDEGFMKSYFQTEDCEPRKGDYWLTSCYDEKTDTRRFCDQCKKENFNKCHQIVT